MSQLTDIQNLIRVETENCAFQKKRSGNFIQQVGRFFTAQRKYEPACELAARAKYADQLAAAQQVSYQNQQDIQNAFNNLVYEGMDEDSIKIIVAALAAIVIVAWLIS